MLQKMFLFGWLLLTFAPARFAQASDTPLVSGMKITRSATFASGTHNLQDQGSGVAQISGSDFTVDFRGMQLRGQSNTRPAVSQHLRMGLHITDARNVTIKNADVSGYDWGIVIERSTGIRLINCVTSRNADLPPGTTIDESGHDPEDEHGGGILLRDSRDCLIQKCVSQHQWDGIDVVRSDNNTIEDGDFSYNGNWGLHLWDSSRNTFRRNRAIWCTTGAGTLYQALTGWQTYDAQAVGIDHNSNENVIADNDLRFGGDAIFIRANEGPIAPGTVVPPRNGSHRNILRGNDCSFSPNNAIEVDLVDDTIIENNNCSYSNYGMWLGYSRRCKVRGNICINDSSKAVEIENGQDDVFENNIFGYDTWRANQALIFLRQNGRDKTPSGPYTFSGNTLYGSERPIMVHTTPALTLKNELLLVDGAEAGKSVMVTDEQGHKFGSFNVNQAQIRGFNTLHAFSLTPQPLRPGGEAILSAPWLSPEQTYLVEIDGIPVWIRRVGNDKLTFALPSDFWDRPARQTATLRLFGHGAWAEPLPVALEWPDNSRQPRMDAITPNPAKIGDTVTITGVHLNAPQTRVLFNNTPVTIVEATPNKLVVNLPPNILTPTHVNVLVQQGAGANRVSTWPIPFTVDVPREQMPHLTNATFSPTTLHVGDLLKVTFTVRNNLPIPAQLMRAPKLDFTYQEKQAAEDVGLAELPNHLHLRVTSDHPGTHDPGSWPYLFGFAQPTLAPGETTTVTGYIRVETPGTHEFRVGLVAGGFRFIDDNAFRTKIVVLPR